MLTAKEIALRDMLFPSKKMCPKCGFERSSYDFRLTSNRGKACLDTYCHEHRRKINKEYKDRNPKEWKEYQKKYHETYRSDKKNKEKANERVRKYYRNNVEKISKRRKEKYRAKKITLLKTKP